MRRPIPWRGRALWAAVVALLVGIVLVPAAQAGTPSDKGAGTVDSTAVSGSSAAGPTADQLRAAMESCGTQLSDGEYAEDEGGTPSIPVCGKNDAVFWQADLDVDCDGQPGDECNENTDPAFQPETACVQSDGEPLNSATLPHVVVPLPSDVWDHAASDVNCGTVGAVVYEDKVVYGVIGDKGPDSIIGEASYAMADELGIDPDPATGGVSGKVVGYVTFPGTEVSKNEDHAEATELGEAAATEFAGDGAR
ncbi:glycoside hydrolase family 75 protein [Streptomyces sulphureus]|uniref:glycoside hydrolase family 75 protein n=1 Tax=Streptomyces sulphureus TaxID=47758 RepID=UPI00037454CF|nr:glycoside hydrolase family 75 protein [Streptomyces sulphureus]